MKLSYILKCFLLVLMFLLFIPLETRAIESGYVNVGEENIYTIPLGKNQKSKPRPNLHSISNNELSKIYQPKLTQIKTNSLRDIVNASPVPFPSSDPLFNPFLPPFFPGTQPMLKSLITRDSSKKDIPENHVYDAYQKRVPFPFVKIKKVFHESDELQHTNLLKIAHFFNDIGSDYYKKGVYERAIEYFLKAFQIYKKIYGNAPHPYILSLFSNLGSTYESKGDYDKTLEYLFKALEINKQVYGDIPHSDTAMCFNNLGNVHYRIGEYDKGLKHHFKALNIKKKVYKDTLHPEIASSFNNIGFAYEKKREYDKALQYYFKALHIYEKAYGKIHPDIFVSYSNLGSTYAAKGKYDKGLKYLFRALEVAKKVYGSTIHPHMGNLLNNLGATYESKKEYDKAIEYFFKALDINKKVLGDKHSLTQKTKENIEIVRKKMAKKPNYTDPDNK